MKQSLLCLAIAASLSLTSCAGWKVNGVDTSGVNSGDTPGFCTSNPGTCIVAGGLAAGVVAGVVVNANSSDNNTGGGGCGRPHGAHAVCN